MSYSFSVRGATLALALAAVAAKMAEVVEQQPVHKTDEPVVNAQAAAVGALLAEAESDRDVLFSVSGSISTAEVSEGAPPFVTGVNVSVGVYLATRVSSEG